MVDDNNSYILVTHLCRMTSPEKNVSYAGMQFNWLSTSHGSTLVLNCCKANHWSHGKKVHFAQPQSAHPPTVTNQNLHGSFRKLDQQLCQIICWRSHHWGPRNTSVKYNIFVRFYSIFYFPSLPFFILAIVYSLNAWIDFHDLWLKMRGLVQGSASCMFELRQTNFGGRYPLKTTRK